MGCKKLIYKPKLSIYSSKNIKGRNGEYIYNYRFAFNGKPNDDEVSGEGNTVDFGARMYDSRIGRWMSIDPMFKKLTSFSVYSFAINSPLILKDEEGKYPIITITDQVVGKTYQRVIGEYTTKKDLIVEVPIYRVIITDSEDPNYKNENYAVTRDAWTVENKSDYNNNNTPSNTADDSYNLSNMTFEPKSQFESFDGAVSSNYPVGSGFEAIALLKNGLIEGFKSNNPKYPIQSNMMMHIGGIYSYKKGPAKGLKRIAASEGCMGTSLNQVLNPSVQNNDNHDNFMTEVKKVMANDKKNPDKIKINVQKRKSIEVSKEIKSTDKKKYQ